jgi:glyoxylase-like metal-dependent hydrolase (beta-lactamase superfamily II)
VKVVMLKRTDQVYSGHAYVALGVWNRIQDINTMIDVGTDGQIVDEIEQVATGVGKNPIEQVVLTHNHFDHTGGLSAVITRHHPRVYAYSPGEGVDELLKDGQFLRIGDEFCQIIHTPGHSSDSICIYCPNEKILFSGDVPLSIKSSGSSYAEDFVEALERIASLDVRIIYSGHNDPVVSGAREMIQMTLENVRRSEIVPPAMESQYP